jgi:CRISPR/Cas system CMR-associated protein Cmr5 small subunit
LIQKTKNFATSSLENVTKRDKDQQIDYQEIKTEKKLPSLLILVKLDQISIQLNSSINNIDEMFNLSFIEKDAVLNELKLLNSEFLIETHSNRKLIVAKSKIGGLSVRNC